MNYIHRNRQENIGDLQVVIDLDGIYQRLLGKFWVILVTNGVKTFLVSGFMLWLFHYLVTRHLRHIAKFAARLGVKNLEEKLQLPRAATLNADEFDLVLEGFNRMQSNLNSALHTLEFVEQLSELLSSYPEIRPEQLELEVLETVAMRDLNRAIDVMSKCKALGVNLSLDDFGTDYSSLAYFRRLPVDTLKIDKSFVHDLTIDNEGKALVESVIRLAELFGRSSIAEGVETIEQLKSLINLGCSNAQGYYFAKPMPVLELPVWLDQWQTGSEWHQHAFTGINKH